MRVLKLDHTDNSMHEFSTKLFKHRSKIKRVATTQAAPSCPHNTAPHCNLMFSHEISHGLSMTFIQFPLYSASARFFLQLAVIRLDRISLIDDET